MLAEAEPLLRVVLLPLMRKMLILRIFIVIVVDVLVVTIRILKCVHCTCIGLATLCMYSNSNRSRECGTCWHHEALDATMCIQY